MIISLNIYIYIYIYIVEFCNIGSTIAPEIIKEVFEIDNRPYDLQFDF